MENLRIYLLGTFRFYRDGVLLTSRDWQIRHARQLFKLLFTERGHTVPASKVIDLLWPYSAEHTHKTLRGVVSILRSVLEPGRASGDPSRFVPRGSLGYTLLLPDDGSVWVDTIEFERLLDETIAGHESPKRRRVLESALQLYAGDYLAEDEHESWTLVERTRLRERYFFTALSLMETQRKLGLYNEAISVGRRALNFDLCREPLYPIIMYCQVALGDTVGALQTFEQCRQELHNRLGIDPSPQTLKLHTELLRGNLPVKPASHISTNVRPLATSAATSATGSSPVQYANGARRHLHDPHLVGRKEVIDYLLHYVDALQDKQARQRTRAIALAGEMGVGKSFLLRHALSYARGSHITTITTSCQAIEQRLPFAPLLVMAKAWLAELSADELASLPGAALAVLSHLLPELLTRVPDLLALPFLNAEQAHNGFIAGFVDLFQACSQQRPFMVAIDDLQWADEASILVLQRLARSSTMHAGQYGSLLLLLSYRSEEVQENVPLHTMLLSLSRCSYFHSLHLLPFSIEEVGAYLKVHTPGHTFSVEQFHGATQGNAFFLAELIRLLADQADQKEHASVARSGSQRDYLLAVLQHSKKIHDAVLARLAHLPERALELLEYASVIGHPFPPTLLGSPLSVEDCRLLDLLLTRNFLVEGAEKDGGVCLSFAYALVEKIVYACCSALKRSLLHLQIAEQLVLYYTASIHLYAKEVAFHYRQAGPQYQLQALQYETDA
ncbi:MAG: hypothetical protein PVSMB5_35250 [Ktedonobacteraceae bacterium]